MRRLILTALLAALAGGLFAQEIFVSAGADVWSNVWMNASLLQYDEKLNVSPTISLGYMQRFAGEAIKSGLGISYWLPRSAGGKPQGYPGRLTFSDIAVYASIQVYPVRLAGAGNLADYLYVRGNLGYNHPIFSGDWASTRLYSSRGDFHFGAGGGIETPFGLSFELLYNRYYWGAEVWVDGGSPGSSGSRVLDKAGYQNFTIVIGYKFSLRRSMY